MKHDQDLCVECAYVGTCNGQPADDCDLMNLVEFEAALNDRLAKLDDQFSTINDVLKEKKEAFKEMYRRNPKISHDEGVSFLLKNNDSFDPANPEGDLERHAMQEQLTDLQDQLVQEAEEMREQLANQKSQLENKCHGLEQRLNEEKIKSQTLFEAIINLQAREKDLEGQLELEKLACQKFESDKISLEKKWDRRQEDLVQTNDKLVKTQREKTNQEQRLNELKSSLSRAERRNEELRSALDNETREKSNLVRQLKKVNSNLYDENFKIEKFTRDLNEDSEALLSVFRIFETEDSEAEASETDDYIAEDFEVDGELRRLEGNLKEFQRRNEEVLSALDNKAREKSHLIGELKKVNSNLRILTRKDSESEDSGSEDSESEDFESEDSEAEDSIVEDSIVEDSIVEVQSALDNEARKKTHLIGELKKVNSNLRILSRKDSESEDSEVEHSEVEDSEADGEIKRLEGHLEEIQKRLQVAERIKAQRTIVCNSFSDDNFNVTVSSCKQCKRSVKHSGHENKGYCFLNHSKIKKNQILRWSLRVPKTKSGNIGMVIILE